MSVFEVGKHYVLFVPPGWMLGGTVREIKDGWLVLSEASYLDATGPKHSMSGDVALATTEEGMREACTRSWDLPEGYLVQIHGILHAAPSAQSMRPLRKKRNADAVRGAR
jgi:hypothetical protein